ncbi:Uu.00g137000.m01.CDS01 [Anthostomella pinea]|uniref:Uu.00g137000.m01.CDS01 n=1 Tax=Anthostomella pinea TaxID=933095 RepID=A0AAI8YL70_9PEZI|nr:Uu.00g137000.m01.CDS01 [Anthostomella pinea]
MAKLVDPRYLTASDTIGVQDCLLWEKIEVDADRDKAAVDLSQWFDLDRFCLDQDVEDGIDGEGFEPGKDMTALKRDSLY